jgi:hypothetical protein
MPKGKYESHGGKAVAWLATCFVLFGGLGTCAFIILAFSDTPVPVLLATVVGILGFVFLLWILRDKQPQDLLRQRYGWLRRGRAAHKSLRLRFGRKSNVDGNTQPQANQPPTAEKVRQIRDESGLNTWVPSDHARREASRD